MFVRFIERKLPSSGLLVLLIGTLDTKSEEIEFVADQIVSSGATPVLLDSSATGGTATSKYALISRAEVALASGSTIDVVAELTRGDAVAAMRPGVEAWTTALVDSGRVQGALCVGGAGAYLAGPAFQALAVGFPKLIVSPLASGKREFEPFMGLRDVTVMHSVADVAGINAITEKVYRSAAGFIVGAARSYSRREDVEEGGQPTIAVSMNGNTTSALSHGRARLEDAGYHVVTFHANGVGGRALEDFVAGGQADAVLDYTTTELGAEVVGGLMHAGRNRMETAGRLGVPQVLCPGCIDLITCGRWEETAREFPGRPFFRHNPELTLVRVNASEMAELGRLFASKANNAVGPTAILIPSRGFSKQDSEEGPFWDPEADRAFVDALLAEISGSVEVEVIDAHQNDPPFAIAAAERLLALIGAATARVGSVPGDAGARGAKRGGNRLAS